MKYVPAGLAALVTWVVAILFPAVVRAGMVSPTGWSAFSFSRDVGVVHGSLSLFAGVAVFWIVATWIKAAAAVRVRKSLAARARA